MRNSHLKSLYEKQWYWYIAALLCIGLSVYWFIRFTGSHDHQDLIVTCITLGIGLLSVWRGFQPPPQEPSDLERMG